MTGPACDLGYLDSVGARRVAPLMERGTDLTAKVGRIEYGTGQYGPFRRIHIAIVQETASTIARHPIRKGTPKYDLHDPV